MTSIQERIDAAGIGATIVRASDNPHMRPDKNSSTADVRWYREATHWRLYLRNASNGEKMQVAFSMGSGHEGREPTVAEVMDNILSDATFAIDNNNYIEFAEELGMEPNTKARRMYDAVVTQTNRLKRFLGEDFELWVYETERD